MMRFLLIVRQFLEHWSSLRITPFTWSRNRDFGECDRSTRYAYYCTYEVAMLFQLIIYACQRSIGDSRVNVNDNALFLKSYTAVRFDWHFVILVYYLYFLKQNGDQSCNLDMLNFTFLSLLSKLSMLLCQLCLSVISKSGVPIFFSFFFLFLFGEELLKISPLVVASTR